MFGAFQAGVWSVLHEFFQPDVVVGASVGSLNGWAIAGGMSADGLIATWLDSRRETPLRFRWPRGIYDGIIDTRHLQLEIQNLYESWTPQCRIGIALTEMWSFQPVLIQGEAIRWEHLAASCGVPLFLPQHRLNNRLYADGGLLTPLPLWGAIEMGVSRAITIDLFAHSTSPSWRMASRFLRWRAGFQVERPDSFAVININPPTSLGDPHSMMNWNRYHIERWIDLGRRAAKEAQPGIEKTFLV